MLDRIYEELNLDKNNLNDFQKFVVLGLLLDLSEEEVL